MPVQSTLSEGENLPGSYWGYRLGGRRGLFPVARRVAIVAAKTSAGTATVLTKYEPSDESEADTLFGKGSECALMFRKAMDQSVKTGRGTPRIFVVAITDPAGTAATFTWIFTGTSTEARTWVGHIGGIPIRVGIPSGTTAAAAAQLVVDKVTELGAWLPVTAGIASATVTLTARQTGVNGNQIRVRHESATVPAGLTCASANAVTGVGAYTLGSALDVLTDAVYHGHAFANITSTDFTAAETHLDTRALPGTKAFGHGYFGSRGSVATTNALATGADEEKISVAGCEMCPNHPGEIAVATMILYESQDKTPLHFNGEALALSLPEDGYAYTDAEKRSHIASGVTPLAPNPTGTDLVVVRAVTTRTTNGASAADTRLLDLPVVRNAFWCLFQYDAACTEFMAQEPNKVKDDATKRRLKSTIYGVMQLASKLSPPRMVNVEQYKDAIAVEDHASVLERYVVEAPTPVPVPNHQVDGNAVLHVGG